jgi:hypothetical protein
MLHLINKVEQNAPNGSKVTCSFSAKSIYIRVLLPGRGSYCIRLSDHRHPRREGNTHFYYQDFTTWEDFEECVLLLLFCASPENQSESKIKKGTGKRRKRGTKKKRQYRQRQINRLNKRYDGHRAKQLQQPYEGL